MKFEFLKSFFKNFQKSEVESRPSRPFQFSTLVELIPELLVGPQSTFPVNRSKDFLDFWHKVRP